MRSPRYRKLITVAVVAGATLGFAGKVVAEPRFGADRAELRRQLLDLQRRQRELDEKIRQLEAEIENDRLAQPPVPSSMAPSTSSTPGSALAAQRCVLPFYLDGSGIRRLRPECVEIADRFSCDQPYVLDKRGVRQLRQACTSSAPAVSHPAHE
jgi:hypothetical protein